jgi:TolB-like protein
VHGWILALFATLVCVHPASAKPGGLRALQKPLGKAASRINGKLSGKVVVLDFSKTDDPSSTSEFGQQVAEVLATALAARAKGYSVVDRRELIAILRDSIMLVGDDEAAIKKLQTNAGMDVLVSGSYSEDGKDALVNLRAVEAATGKILAAQGVVIPITDEIRKMLGHTFARGAAGKPDEPTGTDPLELEAGVFYQGGDDRLYPVHEGMVLDSKDNYAIFLRPSQTAYVYIYQVDAARKAQRLFPEPRYSERKNPLSPGEYWIPSERGYFYLDENKGQENILILAARAPMPELEAATALPRSDIDRVIRTMGVAGTRGSETVSKTRSSQSAADGMVVKKLAAAGGFFYELGIIHR